MTTRIETTFNTLREQNKKALIPYVMAGDPNPSVTVSLLHELVDTAQTSSKLACHFPTPWQTVKLSHSQASAH